MNLWLSRVLIGTGGDRRKIFIMQEGRYKEEESVMENGTRVSDDDQHGGVDAMED